MPEPKVRRNVAISVANVAAVVGASLLAVPLIVDRLGLEGYGLWTLAQSIVIYITTAELGVGPALARFTSVHAGDPHAARRIAMTALLGYLVAGLVAVLGLGLLAGPLVALFDVPTAFVADAESTVRLMGWVSLVALLAGALGHVLVGMERFAAFTLTNAAGSALFLVALVVLTDQDATLRDIALAALVQWSAVVVLRVGILRRLLLARGGWLAGRAVLRELVSFSARLQAATVATLVNTQTDRILVGLVASARTLGEVGLATQVAEAFRFLAYAAAAPMNSRMAVDFGTRGTAGLADALRRYQPAWRSAVIGVIGVGVGGAWPAIEAWIGSGHEEASAYAALLLLGYGVGLLPSPEFGYLRAVGTPGLEGTFGLVTVGLNLSATVVLALVAGAPGIIAATAVAYIASTLWVARRLRSRVPQDATLLRVLVRSVASAAVAGAATFAAGQALVDALPRLVALLGVGVVAVLALAGHMAASGRPVRATG